MQSKEPMHVRTIRGPSRRSHRDPTRSCNRVHVMFIYCEMSRFFGMGM